MTYLLLLLLLNQTSAIAAIDCIDIHKLHTRAEQIEAKFPGLAHPDQVSSLIVETKGVVNQLTSRKVIYETIVGAEQRKPEVEQDREELNQLLQNIQEISKTSEVYRKAAEFLASIQSSPKPDGFRADLMNAYIPLYLSNANGLTLGVLAAELSKKKVTPTLLNELKPIFETVRTSGYYQDEDLAWVTLRAYQKKTSVEDPIGISFLSNDRLKVLLTFTRSKLTSTSDTTIRYLLAKALSTEIKLTSQRAQLLLTAFDRIYRGNSFKGAAAVNLAIITWKEMDKPAGLVTSIDEMLQLIKKVYNSKVVSKASDVVAIIAGMYNGQLSLTTLPEVLKVAAIYNQITSSTKYGTKLTSQHFSLGLSQSDTENVRQAFSFVRSDITGQYDQATALVQTWMKSDRSQAQLEKLKSIYQGIRALVSSEYATPLAKAAYSAGYNSEVSQAIVNIYNKCRNLDGIFESKNAIAIATAIIARGLDPPIVENGLEQWKLAKIRYNPQQSSERTKIAVSLISKIQVPDVEIPDLSDDTP